MTTVAATIGGDIVQYETVTWLAMADTNDGAGVDAAKYGEMAVQAIGDATSITMQGSNDGGTTWSALGAGVSLVIAAGKTPVTRIAEHPGLIRPLAVGGTSTKVILIGRKVK